MESKIRRRITIEFRILYHTNNRRKSYKKTRRRHRFKVERESKRNSLKSVKIFFRTRKERDREKYKALVCYRIRRTIRQNSFTRYIFRSKISGTNKKTLEIWICIYRGILQLKKCKLHDKISSSMKDLSYNLISDTLPL